mmetsp:Transcript_2104/g.3745  ORF Transcript_2104/g.3745 Transcript_2104/m.3745 type:complete len:384 (-) Transcript_2104:2457-3608(-)
MAIPLLSSRMSSVTASFTDVVVVVLILVLAIPVDAFLEAFGDASMCNGRYFTQTGHLPPLSTTASADWNGTDFSSLNVAASTTTTHPSIAASIPVTYTNNPRAVDNWLCKNLPYEGSIIGFDIERLPQCRSSKFVDGSSFAHGATVQLATPKSCLVVHLVRRNGRHSYGCAPILKSVLADENYVKAGCAIDGDLIELHDLWGTLEARSRFDLGIVFPRNRNSNIEDGTTKKYDKPQTIRNKSGLKSLSRSILGIDLPKENWNCHSDWSSVPLSEDQIIYAARDAWAGAAIANELAEYDPDFFGREALIELFERTETPIPELAERRRRRKEAKEDLESLLLPYSEERVITHALPKKVQQKVKQLRSVINARIIDHHFIFETSHS